LFEKPLGFAYPGDIVDDPERAILPPKAHEPETTVFLLKGPARVDETCKSLGVKVIARIAENVSNVQGACAGRQVRKNFRIRLRIIILSALLFNCLAHSAN